MPTRRRKNQLELAFTWDDPGESAGAQGKGTEVGMAQTEAELPARLRGPSMEAVVEPRNLLRALERGKRAAKPILIG